MEDNKMMLVENEEVMETLVDEVVESGSKMSTMAGIGIGVGLVVASYVVAKNAPKVGRAILGKIAERKANKVEKDYVTEELEADEEITSSEEE